MTSFILALFSTRNKLRISSLYQVITGKRTSSVLIYSFLNHLLFIHGSFPKMNQEEFTRIIDQLVDQKFLIQLEDGVMITHLGEKTLAEKKIDLEGLHYDRYGRTAENCWRLIKFAVQVVSHLVNNKKEYLPVETSPYYTIQVKKWLADTQLDRQTLAKKLSQELSEIFSTMTSESANFLANQFSGIQSPGLLTYQLTEITNEVQRELYEAKQVHLLLKTIEEKKDSLLFQLVSPLLMQNFNQSMLTTRKLILSGCSIDEVMKIRHLKRGTVTDHLIEWQLYLTDFPYQKMITKQTFKRLSQLSNIKEWNYRELNEVAPLDYGEFRFYQIGVLKGELKNVAEG